MKLKKLISLFTAFIICFTLVACSVDNSSQNQNNEESSSDINIENSNQGSSSEENSSNESSSGGSSVSTDIVPQKVPNMFMACDQYNERIVLYDLDKLQAGDDLDKGEIWSLDAGYCADMKYRENTVFGNVVITAGRTSGIYSYPDKKAIWTTNDPGNNPHSVEILPNGDIVIASSTGATIRYFNTRILKLNPNAKVTYIDYTLEGAHGVLWDPKYNCLWALGDFDLVAYRHDGSSLTKINGMGGSLPIGYRWGHDLSADLTNSQYLYYSSAENGTIRFNKEKNTFNEKFLRYEILSRPDQKGFGNNENGNFVYISPESTDKIGKPWENHYISGWCTDKIHFIYRLNISSVVDQTYTSSTSAFYKTRIFCGKYQ